MNGAFILVTLLNGLSSASSLFLLASGLSIIFGVTRIVNFAHGSFFMLGAFIAGSLIALLPTTGLGYWAGVAAAALAVGVLGIVVEMALMGRNGAGKSTTLKTIIGLLRPAAGTVTFAGQRIDGAAPSAIGRRGIGYVPEERRIFTDLTVMENLMVGRQERRPETPYWTPESLFALFPNLAEMGGRRADRMSGGEQQMLAIARALMGNPALLLLDEPSQGLSPKILSQLAETILGLKSQGLAILLAEQNLRFAARIADSAAIIERGTIRYTGDFAELMRDEEIQRHYLGA